MDNPEHHPARKMLQAPFTPSRLREMESIIRAHAERLLQSAGPDRQLEFVHGFATPLALAVIGGIMGVPEKDFPLLEHAVSSAFRVASASYGEDEELPLARAQLAYWEYLQALVQERRAAPRGDFASVLASYVNDDGTTPSCEEVASQLSAILSAGFETSAQMMSFGVRSMVEHRDQWELLQSNRSLLPQAVEECVRHRTLIKRIFRLAVADVEVGGVLIPQGSLVAVTLGAANHDASVFGEPERFDITRSRANLAFGNGTHFCLGAPLAKLEMRITLETLLDLAPGIELVASEEIDYVPHMIVDGMVAMHVDLGPPA
jgi:cytochrome P450